MRPNPSTRQKPRVGCLVTLLVIGLAICALIVTIRHQQTAQQEKERAQQEASDRRLEGIQKKGAASYLREAEAVGDIALDQGSLTLSALRMRLGSVGEQPKTQLTKNEVEVMWICTYSGYSYGGCNVYADFYSPDGSVSDSDEAAVLTIRTTKLEDSTPELFKASICGVRLGDEVSDARNHAHAGCARGWSLGWTDKNGILQSVSLENPRYHLEPLVH